MCSVNEIINRLFDFSASFCNEVKFKDKEQDWNRQKIRGY
ncbi:hypothetical protein PROVRUST_04693 [Providencia rustigianii DSM 4541]|uniref:Uncharacterized protein n=1 Tax=Providencia rustigianii DSM 4541 TaxID=500637 RepID=D1NXR0_9GAMM|nr:hypothetical protein PROVRUST_04693 [Providencia rustigianii DSM 4541]